MKIQTVVFIARQQHAMYAERVRYCLTNSVRLSVYPSNVGIVSKRMDTLFDNLVGTSL